MGLYKEVENKVDTLLLSKENICGVSEAIDITQFK